MSLLKLCREDQAGWLVYAIDPAYAPEGANGAVPPGGITGAWKIADDGTPTGDYQANPGLRDEFAAIGLGKHRWTNDWAAR